MIEYWNGSSWAVVTSPNVNTSSNRLFGVACTSASSCWAVGGYYDPNIAQNFVLVERWNGSSWTIVSAPSPAGPDCVLLRSVTCNSASDCWAVGANDGTTLTEHWDGSAWSIVSSPNVGGSGYLYGVTCRSAFECWAVGDYYGGSHASGTLVEHWTGYFMAGCLLPTSLTTESHFSDVICTSTVCYAVGDGLDKQGYHTLVESYNGNWSIVTSPTSDAGPLNGVTCYPVRSAGPWARPIPRKVRRTLAERLPASGSWTIVATPNPIPPSSFVGGTCVFATDCWVVGNYMAGTRALPAFAKWDGKSWSRIHGNVVSNGNHYLQGVTCTSANQCWAVGQAQTQNGNELGNYGTLIEQWTGGPYWQLVPSPNATTTQTNDLFSVACATGSQCFAVGYYQDDSLNAHSLLEQWNGSSWSLGALPAQGVELFGVTCPSSSQCWAVGYQIFGSGFSAYYGTLIEQWNGSSWATVVSPNATDNNTNILSSVSCTATNDCWAAGYYYNGSAYQTLTEHWDGTGWLIVPSPNSGSSSNLLTSVACNSSTGCWTVGYDGTAGAYQTLTEHWDGVAWSIVAAVNPGTPHDNVLGGVFCAPNSFCWAAGSYNDGAISRDLIEVYSPAIPAVKSAASRLNHHGIGPFDVILPFTGTRGIECRSGAGNYSVVFSFVNDVASCGSAGTPGGTVTAGPLTNQCTENLTGVANLQYITVTLNNVLDVENNSGNVSVPMGVLIGDTTGNGSVNSSDVSQTKARSGQTINALNFRSDVTVSGSINASDVSLVKSKSGTALP